MPSTTCLPKPIMNLPTNLQCHHSREAMSSIYLYHGNVFLIHPSESYLSKMKTYILDENPPVACQCTLQNEKQNPYHGVPGYNDLAPGFFLSYLPLLRSSPCCHPVFLTFFWWLGGWDFRPTSTLLPQHLALAPNYLDVFFCLLYLYLVKS